MNQHAKEAQDLYSNQGYIRKRNMPRAATQGIIHSVINTYYMYSHSLPFYRWGRGRSEMGGGGDGCMFSQVNHKRNNYIPGTTDIISLLTDGAKKL